MNLRKVKTRVQVNDEHSVVRTNTELAHKYCVKQFAIKKIHKIGIDVPMNGMPTGSLAFAIVICSEMLLYIKRNPGNGSKCWKKSIQRQEKQKLDDKFCW